MNGKLHTSSVLVVLSLFLASCAAAPTPDISATNEASYQSAFATQAAINGEHLQRDIVERTWLGEYQGVSDYVETHILDSGETSTTGVHNLPCEFHIGGPCSDCDLTYSLSFAHYGPLAADLQIEHGYSEYVGVWLHLPDPGSWGTNITITDTTILIEPTDDFPYRILVRKLPGPFSGLWLQGTITGYQLSPQGALYISDYVPIFSVTGEGEYAYTLPEGVTPEYISRVQQIYYDVSMGLMTQERALAELDGIQSQIGQTATAWIVRNLPAYNAVSGTWSAFEDYATALARDTGVNPNSRLAQDPVGTAIDLVYGNPSQSEILDWIGFGN
jgi:hypothetical protein